MVEEKMTENINKLLLTLINITMIVYMIQMVSSMLQKVSATVGGGEGGAGAEEEIILSDNFDDGVIDTNKWITWAQSPITISETQGVLRFSAPPNTARATSSQVVSVQQLKRFKSASVTVKACPFPLQCGLVVSSQQSPNSWYETNTTFYRMVWRPYNNTVYVQRVLTVGGTIETLTTVANQSLPLTFKIELVDNTINFYIGATKVYSETFQLASKDLYVYLYMRVADNDGSGNADFDDLVATYYG